jgi:hypothetical protein
MSLPSSGWRNKSSKKLARYVIYTGFLFGLIFNPENGGDIFLLNVG